MPSFCRSCKASLMWTTSTSGKPMPLDSEPDAEKGNVIVMLVDQNLAGQELRLGVTLSGDALKKVRENRYYVLRTEHHATCPDAELYRNIRPANANRQATAKDGPLASLFERTADG
jgi:hypothetical protein